jgi:hypothetical protein
VGSSLDWVVFVHRAGSFSGPLFFTKRNFYLNMSSVQQIAANQANAQLSTGPRTEEGKKCSSLNALKSGLTGRTVLLPGEDASAYKAHCEAFMEGFDPVGEEETALVQLLADTRWRLDRCSVLETNLFALGQVEFQDLFPEELPQVRQALIQAHTFRAYQRDFRNLSTQEGRLQRTFQRELDKLHALQTERREREMHELAKLRKAATAYLAAKKENRPFDPVRNGFEFSIEEIEEFLTAPKPELARAA